MFSIIDSISTLQISNLSNYHYHFTKSDIMFCYFSNKSKSENAVFIRLISLHLIVRFKKLLLMN